MATTTATITIASSDIIRSTRLSVSNTATLTKSWYYDGIRSNNWVKKKNFSISSLRLALIDLDHYQAQTLTENKAAKVYIKNTGTSTVNSVRVDIVSAGGVPTEIGDLYGGDWMFFPYSAVWTSAAHAGNQDIMVEPSTADSVTLEYIIIYE
jgi:predicted extracellular nuclease